MSAGAVLLLGSLACQGNSDVTNSEGLSSDTGGSSTAVSSTLDAADTVAGSEEDGASTTGSPPADGDDTSATGSDSLQDFISIYIAGGADVGPAGLDGAVGLQASPWQAEILSNGDFIVLGEEEFNAGGSSGLDWGDAVYRFSGEDGTLIWKHAPKLGSPSIEVLLGVGSDDVSYFAAGATTVGIQRHEPDGTVILPAQGSGDALQGELQAMFGASYQMRLARGLVTDDDRIVVSLTVDSNTVLFAVYDTSTELLFVASQGLTRYPVGLRERAPGEIVAATSDYSSPDESAASHLQILELQLDTGELAATPIDTDRYAAGPRGPSRYTPTWSPIDLQVAEGSDVWILAMEHYADSGPPRHHIFRVGLDGTVLAHVLAEPDQSGLLGELDSPFMESLTVTPAGPLAVGHYVDSVGSGFYRHSMALLYDNDLSFLEDYQLADLADYDVEWVAADTRDGRTIMVGEIERDTIVSHGTVFPQ